MTAQLAEQENAIKVLLEALRPFAKAYKKDAKHRKYHIRGEEVSEWLFSEKVMQTAEEAYVAYENTLLGKNY